MEFIARESNQCSQIGTSSLLALRNTVEFMFIENIFCIFFYDSILSFIAAHVSDQRGSVVQSLKALFWISCYTRFCGSLDVAPISFIFVAGQQYFYLIPNYN